MKACLEQNLIEKRSSKFSSDLNSKPTQPERQKREKSNWMIFFQLGDVRAIFLELGVARKSSMEAKARVPRDLSFSFSFFSLSLS